VCGAAGDSCCESPLVTGASFLRQNDPSLPATVSSFRLDKYETTVGRFRAFVEAVGPTSWHPAVGSGKHTHLARGGLDSVKELAVERGWDPAWDTNVIRSTTAWNDRLGCMGATWTSSRGANEDRPIVCVSWYDAYAFCIWDGGFLPSYAEWSYAAVGGRDQRMYPWGNDSLDLNHAQFCSNQACAPIDVGFKVPGNGFYGQSDLAGNVWEWVLDSFSPTTSDACNDCVVFNVGSDRAVTGGGFDSTPPTLAAGFVAADSPDHFDLSDGFRCARPP
jgi:formylglycine-generating enzyme required for sulfatase activity